MMIKMFVAGVGLEGRSGQPVILLNDESKTQALPILVGMTEAKAITKAIQKIPSTRPSTHELMFEMVTAFGYQLDHISIEQIKGEYWGKMTLIPTTAVDDSQDRVMEIDARPSDAIILALIQQAPILVSGEVLDDSGINLEPALSNEEMEQFKEFVKDVKASDFNRFGSGPVELPE